jgi:peptidoglycan biosynthesis protein MviN/MurJ (putative lipid II flippase)
LKTYIMLTLPLAFSFSLLVTDEWISKYFASGFEARALSYLSYARTEMRIPFGCHWPGGGCGRFPLSRQTLVLPGRKRDYGSTLLREIMKMWAAGPLAALVLYYFALPATHWSFYGAENFTAGPPIWLILSLVLKMYSLGVFFWVVQVLLSRGFFYACPRKLESPVFRRSLHAD